VVEHAIKFELRTLIQCLWQEFCLGVRKNFLGPLHEKAFSKNRSLICSMC